MVANDADLVLAQAMQLIQVDTPFRTRSAKTKSSMEYLNSHLASISFRPESNDRAARSAALCRVRPDRRTCAKLCHSSGGEIEQLQFLLGHASVQTTERYLPGLQAKT